MDDAPHFVERWADFANYFEKDGKVYTQSIDGESSNPRTDWTHWVDLESSTQYLVGQM